HGLRVRRHNFVGAGDGDDRLRAQNGTHARALSQWTTGAEGRGGRRGQRSNSTAAIGQTVSGGSGRCDSRAHSRAVTSSVSRRMRGLSLPYREISPKELTGLGDGGGRSEEKVC